MSTTESPTVVDYILAHHDAVESVIDASGETPATVAIAAFLLPDTSTATFVEVTRSLLGIAEALSAHQDSEPDLVAHIRSRLADVEARA